MNSEKELHYRGSQMSDTNLITIRVPYSETTRGSCYVDVELKNGETAEQYLVRVRNDSAPLLVDAISEEWLVEDSDSLSFEVDEAEICFDDNNSGDVTWDR